MNESAKRYRRHAGRKETAAYMNRHPVSIARYERVPKLGFPQPAYVNGKPIFDLDEIDAWLASRKGAKA